MKLTKWKKQSEETNATTGEIGVHKNGKEEIDIWLRVNNTETYITVSKKDLVFFLASKETHAVIPAKSNGNAE